MQVINCIHFLSRKTQKIMSAVFTDANYKTDVLASDKLTVVDFWAPWCGPCIALGPTIEGLAETYAGRANIGKVNLDENPEISIAYGITSIPAVLFIKNGQVVDKQIGLAPRKVLEEKVQKHL
jgi:thioredoxin 1